MSSKLSPAAERMRALALDLPNQVEAGFKTGRELGGTPRSVRQAVVVGMGGSAIAADLIRGVTDPETDLVLGVTRGPAIPRAAGPEAWAVLASYSGETWETLSAYSDAGRRGLPRIAISSGGELARRAERDGVPHLLLPPGLPPRAALGYSLGGLLGILDPFFPESNERRVRDATAHLRERGAELARPKGPAHSVAETIGARSPHIYAEAAFAGLARRWKTQIEENAKRLAHFDLLPELFHNALVPWDALSPTSARDHAVVLLEWRLQSPSIRWGFRYLERVLAAKGVHVAPVELASEDRLDALLDGVAFGDHVSLFLAERAGVDPLAVDAIVRLKQAQQEEGLGRESVPRPPDGRPRGGRPRRG